MKLKLLILVLALQSAWLLGTAAVQEHALATGKVILLETARVDPRDLLQGDYLILNYKISDVPTNLFSPPVTKDLPYDTKVFVALGPATNQFYVVVKASTNEFTPASDGILLKAKAPGRVGMQRPIPSTSNTDWNAFTSPKARAIRPANSPRRWWCPRPAAAASRKCLWTASPTPRR